MRSIAQGCFLPKLRFPDLFSVFSGALFDSICVFVVCAAAYALCNIPSIRVRVKGLGLVWCWIATVGMAVSVVTMLTAGLSTGQPGERVYRADCFSRYLALPDMSLLLTKRRIGLYFILLGAGLTLAALIVTTLSLSFSWRYAVRRIACFAPVGRAQSAVCLALRPRGAGRERVRKSTVYAQPIVKPCVSDKTWVLS